MKRLSLPVLPTIMIAGAVIPADALELGTIAVQSNLGQPLRASIAYALAPDEALSDYCIGVAPSETASTPLSISGAKVSLANGMITIEGTRAVSQPLLPARLEVSCPDTPNITREFMLFVDPATASVGRGADFGPAARALPPAVATTSLAQSNSSGRAPAVEKSPIAMGARYRVQVGDSLSKIVSRLENRQGGASQAAEAIFRANPRAFSNGDPNKLLAGAVLEIPNSFSTPASVTETPVASDTIETAPAEAAVEPMPEAAVGSDSSDDTPYLTPASSGEPMALEPPVREMEGMIVDRPAGDASAADSDAIVEPVTAPGLAAEAPVEPVSQPASASKPSTGPVATQSVAPPESSNDGNAVLWILGGAFAVIAGLILRRRRRTEEPEDVISEAAARRRPQPAQHPEDDSIDIEVIDSPEAVAALDYDLSDDVPTEENPALDLNLFEGDGLSDSQWAEAAQIAIAANNGLDFELFEEDTRDPEEPETDIIPTLERSTGSILESEVLPEEHDYDMSVIMDATKMPMPEEATERDLQAVVVDDDTGYGLAGEDGYTLNQEVDYQILEQDYEDTMSATQALKVEIERASRQLSDDLDQVVAAESKSLSHDETAALPVARMAELDLTLNQPAGNDDFPTLGDTELNDELTVDLDSGDQTIEMGVVSTKVDSRGG